MKHNFTREDLIPIERAKTLEEAQQMAMIVLDKMHPSISDHGIKPEKWFYLSRQINESRRKNNVLEIMFNILLAGEGLASVTSRYQAKFM